MIWFIVLTLFVEFEAEKLHGLHKLGQVNEP